jgi:transketolase
VNIPLKASDRRLSVLAKQRLLKMHFESVVGHIGGNLSCIDILLAVYHYVLSEADQFVLSKGHAAGALYVTLWTVGKLSDDDLMQFHRDNTLLSGHPPPQGIPGILFATGSLGHGIGLSAGLALGMRLAGKADRVICLTSDGEWNEGSSWESLIFAKHHGLSNLAVIVDENGLQGFGTTEEVANLAPLSERFRAFGLTTLEIDGHDLMAISEALSTSSSDGPLMIVARTIKGYGVSFMEHQLAWHYLPMNSEQFIAASREVGER